MAPEMARRSLLALVVLSFLSERPMHAYKMFQLLQQREKGSIVNVAQRNSLYQAMNRLAREGLADVDAMERADRRPERTVYRITAAGEALLHDWTLELLTSERAEYPSMPVAISLMMLLSPAEVEGALATRLDSLRHSHGLLIESLRAATGMQLPRLFVLDEEYRLAVIEARLRWLEALLADLRSGAVSWSAEWIAEIAARFEPHD
jgi:DNA-binding PadR family transcriptional regulator